MAALGGKANGHESDHSDATVSYDETLETFSDKADASDVTTAYDSDHIDATVSYDSDGGDTTSYDDLEKVGGGEAAVV